MECLICFEELDEGNSIEYQAHAEGEWWPALFCADCVEQLRLTSRRSWENQVRNSSCEKEQRNLLNRGPPDRVRDVNGFPKCQDGQVYNLRKQKDKQVSLPINICSLNSLLHVSVWVK